MYTFVVFCALEALTRLPPDGSASWIEAIGVVLAIHFSGKQARDGFRAQVEREDASRRSDQAAYIMRAGALVTLTGQRVYRIADNIRLNGGSDFVRGGEANRLLTLLVRALERYNYDALSEEEPMTAFMDALEKTMRAESYAVDLAKRWHKTMNNEGMEHRVKVISCQTMIASGADTLVGMAGDIAVKGEELRRWAELHSRAAIRVDLW